MSFKFAENNNLDPLLTNWVWLNTQNQTHVFKSILHTKYPVADFPWMWERVPKVTAKPGRLTVLPHRYYVVHTRDGSPAVGREMTMNEAIEEYSAASLTRGEEADENRHEKKN